MSTELNLTEDQRRRIEGAMSAEEKVAVIMEAVDAGMELSDEQLEAVSGGKVRYTYYPPTHEEVDKCWNLIQSLNDIYGEDVAVTTAYEMRLIPELCRANGNYFRARHSISECRSLMHDYLDGRDVSMSWG